MRAILIDPFVKTISEIDTDAAPANVRKLVGIDDYTVTSMGSRVIGFLDDIGLYRKGQNYFYLHVGSTKLVMAGKVLLMSSDDMGDTVGLDDAVTVPFQWSITHWLGDAQALEKAILDGIVPRPATSINGVPVWQWTPESEGKEPAAW